jgi:4-hydroxyphenylacetate 3-monooxygenase
MVRAGEQYSNSIRDEGVVCVGAKRVSDVTTHFQFKPLVDLPVRIYHWQYETSDIMATGQSLPKFPESEKRNQIRSQKCQLKK